MADALRRSYGLDVDFVDQDGRNAFANVADRFFVMSIHGEINEPALDKLLSAPFAVPAATGFARYLIDAGANVERSHLELMDAIRGSDPALYERIVKTVPELRRP